MNKYMEKLRQHTIDRLEYSFGGVWLGNRNFVFIDGMMMLLPGDMGIRKRAICKNEQMNAMGYQPIWEVDLKEGDAFRARKETGWKVDCAEKEDFYRYGMNMLNGEIKNYPVRFIEYGVIYENGKTDIKTIDSFAELSVKLCDLLMPVENGTITWARVNGKKIDAVRFNEIVNYVNENYVERASREGYGR